MFYEKIRSDSIKYWLVNDYVKDGSDKQKILLAKNLLANFEEEPKFTDPILTSENFTISTSKSITDSLIQNHRDRILGFINISSIVYNQDSSKSCVFYNPNLGEYGGGAYLIFLEKQDLWKIEEIKKLTTAE